MSSSLLLLWPSAPLQSSYVSLYPPPFPVTGTTPVLLRPSSFFPLGFFPRMSTRSLPSPSPTFFLYSSLSCQRLDVCLTTVPQHSLLPFDSRSRYPPLVCSFLPLPIPAHSVMAHFLFSSVIDTSPIQAIAWFFPLFRHPRRHLRKKSATTGLPASRLISTFSIRCLPGPLPVALCSATVSLSPPSSHLTFAACPRADFFEPPCHRYSQIKFLELSHRGGHSVSAPRPPSCQYRACTWHSMPLLARSRPSTTA